jgi:hypothetical protein
MAKFNLPGRGKTDPDHRPRHIRLSDQEFQKGHALYIDRGRERAHFSGTKSKISFAHALEAADELGKTYAAQIHFVGKKTRRDC